MIEWVIEGMLEMAGFNVNRVDRDDGLTASFLCTKIPKGNTNYS